MDNHETVLTIKGHDQIHMLKRSLCVQEGEWIRRGQSGKRETRRGQQPGSRLQGTEAVWRRRWWVWPDLRDVEEAKSIGQKLFQRWDSLDVPQLHFTQILLSLFIALPFGQNQSIPLLFQGSALQSFPQRHTPILSIFPNCDKTYRLHQTFYLIVHSLVLFYSCFKYCTDCFPEGNWVSRSQRWWLLHIPANSTYVAWYQKHNGQLINTHWQTAKS